MSLFQSFFLSASDALSRSQVYSSSRSPSVLMSGLVIQISTYALIDVLLASQVLPMMAPGWFTSPGPRLILVWPRLAG